MSAIRFAPEAVEKLMRLAEAGMREDADEVSERARESLMRVFRLAGRGGDSPLKLRLEDMAEWGDGELKAIEWIARLAATGHASAQHLVDRILWLRSTLVYEWGAAELKPAPGVIEAIERMVPGYPPLARFLAVMECLRPQPDYGKARHWLLACGLERPSAFDEHVAALAAATADAAALCKQRDRILQGCWQGASSHH